MNFKKAAAIWITIFQFGNEPITSLLYFKSNAVKKGNVNIFNGVFRKLQFFVASLCFDFS
jgi:hypothetical protein